MSVRDDLIAAKALIDTPEKWCKNKPAWNGQKCAEAAVATATAGHDYRPSLAALCKALPPAFMGAGNAVYAFTNGAISRFNDSPSTSHADIMALFDRAIAAAPVTP